MVGASPSLALPAVAPDLVRHVAAGEGQTDAVAALAGGVGPDAVDLRRRDDTTDGPRAPQVVHLLAEDPVDLLGGRLAGSGVGVLTDDLELGVHVGILEAPEVERQGADR